ncbi:MAG TPA: class I SAM-dependent methyltransferase [Anaerolineales bacterium]|nr:class I SAM-dependent methyltransferase [Anaerolineales bacterium]
MDPELYLDVREREGRLYPDHIVARLPFIPESHALAAEWRARSASAWRLIRYLSSKPQPLSILDFGCGTGWLSNLLSKAGQSVIGLDQNRYELKQAARVFLPNPKLGFLEANIFSAPFSDAHFDVIILASVLQYFRDVPTLISVLSSYLKPQGEIHILDTPLYSDGELNAAILRSHQYYTSLGFPEMIDHYFHHRLSDFDGLNPKILYQPKPFVLRLKRWIRQSASPFPWAMIKKTR